MEKPAAINYTGRMPRKPTTWKYNLAPLCKDVRAEEDLTQKQMADRLGVSEDTFANWESGRSQPTAEALIELLKLRANKRAISLKALLPEID